MRSGDIKAGQTSRGSRDVSHDDRDQAGASARNILVSSLVLTRQAQARSTQASNKGFNISATRPRPAGRQDGCHRPAHHRVTACPLCRRRPPFVRTRSCRGKVGKRRRPRPINHDPSTEAAGFWGPRCSELDPWLRREAKPERTLGPGATVGVLGMGVPRLACLRPTAWLSQRAVRPIFIKKASKTLPRRTTQDLLRSGLARQAH